MFNFFNLHEFQEGPTWHGRLIRSRMPYLSERPYDWAFIFQYSCWGPEKAPIEQEVLDVAQAFSAIAPVVIAYRANVQAVDRNFESDEYVGRVHMRGFFEGAKPEGYVPPAHVTPLEDYLRKNTETVTFGLGKAPADRPELDHPALARHGH